MKELTKFEHVESATVTLLKKGGQGILVPGNLIITAAHCIDFSCEGEMAMGEYFIEEIQTIKGKLKVTPLAVEPVSDIAVLGALDAQEAPKELRDFEMFCEQTKAIPICQREFQLFKKMNVHVYTHNKTWIKGSAMQCQKEAELISVEFGEQVEPGTSGSPIINSSGELVGIVSNTTILNREGEKSIGMSPRPHRAVPVWIINRISEAQH